MLQCIKQRIEIAFKITLSLKDSGFFYLFLINRYTKDLRQKTRNL